MPARSASAGSPDAGAGALTRQPPPKDRAPRAPLGYGPGSAPAIRIWSSFRVIVRADGHMPHPVPPQPQQEKTPLVTSIASSRRRGCRSAPTVPPPGRCPPAPSAIANRPPAHRAMATTSFPPVSFSLQWDGHDVMWTWEGAGTWLPLKSAQFPDFRDLFDAGRTRGDPRILTAVPRRPAGAGPDPMLDRHRCPHRARLEPDGARPGQYPTQRHTTNCSRGSSRPTAGSAR